MLRRLNNRLGNRGATAVETAILLIAILLFVFGLTEFGRGIWTQATLDFAVQTAARCAVANKTVCGNASQTQDFAVTQAAALNLSTSVFTVTTQTCGTQVSASLPYQFAVPNLLPYRITLTATACYPS